MNFTGGNTLPNIGKRINWQLITMAGGLALAISAGALSGVFERGGSSPSTSVTRPSAPAVSSPVRTAAGPTEAAYILVGSQQEAAMLESAISSYAAMDEALAASSAAIRVVALENPQQEAQFNATLALATSELMQSGIGVRVFDLREAPSPTVTFDAPNAATPETIVYIVASEAEAMVLRQQFNESSATFGDQTHRDVFVADTQEQQALVQTLIGEQLTTGAFSVVDLR
jgi:hypothetical protein